MIKYHGTPITPIKIFNEVVEGRNLLVSWANPQDLKRACNQAEKIILDNGAFTFWSKEKEANWDLYYQWITENSERLEYFFIPDIIDGTESENDELIREFYYKYSSENIYKKGIPVWHIHESFDRLQRLMSLFDYIGIGSSGEYSRLGTEKWHNRMNEAMKFLCCEDGYPKVKIHMLRCLDPKIFIKYPFYSGDSTNIARNHNRKGWKPIMERIEAFDSPKYYKFKKQIQSLII